jgi:hypothetical protein
MTSEAAVFEAVVEVEWLSASQPCEMTGDEMSLAPVEGSAEAPVQNCNTKQPTPRSPLEPLLALSPPRRPRAVLLEHLLLSSLRSFATPATRVPPRACSHDDAFPHPRDSAPTGMYSIQHHASHRHRAC